MSAHRYSASGLAADYCRAGIGFLATAGPLALLGPTGWLVHVLASLAVLFGVFAVRTLIRQLTAYEATEAGLRVSGPIGFDLAWSDVSDVRLEYYSTRRDRGRGWMQLRVRGAGRTIRLDSTLEGFPDIVGRAAEEAAYRDIVLGDATLDNMRALGITGTPERTGAPVV